MNKHWNELGLIATTATLTVALGAQAFAGDRISLVDIEARLAEIESSAAAVEHTLDVSVFVDLDICRVATPQCIENGAVLGQGANDGNSNPIYVLVHVSKNGEPVTGLPLSAFQATNGLGSLGFAICNGIDCGKASAGGGTTGTYQLYIDPVPDSNWGASVYGGSVRVVDGDDRGSALLAFRVPEAP